MSQSFAAGSQQHSRIWCHFLASDFTNKTLESADGRIIISGREAFTGGNNYLSSRASFEALMLSGEFDANLAGRLADVNTAEY